MSTKVESSNKKAKFNLPKKLVMFGAYYKDDCDDGWSFSMLSIDEPVKGFTQVLHDCIHKAGNHLVKEVESGEIDVNWIKGQMQYYIEQFNIKAFGSRVRPLRSEYQMNLMDPDIMESILVIAGDIYALTILGVIPDNNYNGMNYAYTN